MMAVFHSYRPLHTRMVTNNQKLTLTAMAERLSLSPLSADKFVVLTSQQLLDIIEHTAHRTAIHLRDDVASASTPEIMTKTELADYLRCDVSKINRYMTQGLPFERFGGHPRFRKSDIDRWLRNECVQALQGQEDHNQEQRLG